MFSPEEEADVGLAEVVPADDGGEGEEGQADGEQLRTEAGKGFAEGELGNRRLRAYRYPLRRLTRLRD